MFFFVYVKCIVFTSFHNKIAKSHFGLGKKSLAIFHTKVTFVETKTQEKNPSLECPCSRD